MTLVNSIDLMLHLGEARNSRDIAAVREELAVALTEKHKTDLTDLYVLLNQQRAA